MPLLRSGFGLWCVIAAVLAVAPLVTAAEFVLGASMLSYLATGPAGRR